MSWTEQTRIATQANEALSQVQAEASEALSQVKAQVVEALSHVQELARRTPAGTVQHRGLEPRLVRASIGNSVGTSVDWQRVPQRNSFAGRARSTVLSTLKHTTAHSTALVG